MIRLCLLVLVLVVGLAPGPAGAEMPRDIVEKIALLRIEKARLNHLMAMGQLTQQELNQRALKLRGEEETLWRPYRTLPQDAQLRAESAVKGMENAQLATLMPQWKKAEQDRRASQEENQRRTLVAVEIDARKALEFQRERLRLQQQLTAGTLTQGAFAQRDSAALAAIADIRKKFEIAGRTYAGIFDKRLDQMTKALANDPNTFIPERQAMPLAPGEAPDFQSDVRLARELLARRQESAAKFDKKLIGPDTHRESDVIYGADLQQLELRYEAISPQRGNEFRTASQGRGPVAASPQPSQTPAVQPSPPVQYATPVRTWSEWLWDQLLEVFNILMWTTLGASICYALYWLAMAKKRREKKDEARWAAHNRAEMERLGATPEERAAKVDALFDLKAGEVPFKLNEPGVKCDMVRQISTMSPKEREALRIAYHLYNLGMAAHENNFFVVRLSLVFAQGKGVIFKGATYKDPGIASIQDAIRKRTSAIDIDPAVDVAFRDLTAAIQKHPDHPVLHKLAANLFGTGGDLIPGPPLKTEQRAEPETPRLILGLDPRDPNNWWYYDGEGSLITVAPPGAGKTQSQVFPNLLMWKGPAVVLDVKGEIFEQTSKWRRENVGPVYKFSPLNPSTSHCYNPLAMVRSDPQYLWEDSRFLADMMIVPTGAKDPFWESRARDVLTAAIARICVKTDVVLRSMEDVLDIMHGVNWTSFVSYLQSRIDIRAMTRAGNSLAEMDQKMRDSVLQSAQASLSAWVGERIRQATSHSDWSPLDLRSGQNPTVYICLTPNEIGSYTSLLRVLIAQHIRGLTASLPPHGTDPILFVLDELPRLGHMPPVEEALEIGRQYGLKLWMFAQNLGQLAEAYPNAEGMVGSCAVRMFMNPSDHDGTAEKLSDSIGFRESIIDGTRVKIVEPNVLSGPEFKDLVIVMAASAKPARLRKYFAYEDPNLTVRMGSL